MKKCKIIIGVALVLILFFSYMNPARADDRWPLSTTSSYEGHIVTIDEIKYIPAADPSASSSFSFTVINNSGITLTFSDTTNIVCIKLYELVDTTYTDKGDFCFKKGTLKNGEYGYYNGSLTAGDVSNLYFNVEIDIPGEWYSKDDSIEVTHTMKLPTHDDVAGYASYKYNGNSGSYPSYLYTINTERGYCLDPVYAIGYVEYDHALGGTDAEKGLLALMKYGDDERYNALTMTVATRMFTSGIMGQGRSFVYGGTYSSYKTYIGALLCKTYNLINGDGELKELYK